MRSERNIKGPAWRAVLPAVIAWALGVSWNCELRAAGQVPVIAAASSLNPALVEVSRAFSSDTGKHVRLSFGASGNIVRQIVQGAPYQLFLSADEDYVESVVRRSLALDGGELYAIGQLVVYAPTGSSVSVDPALRDVRQAATDGRLQRLAIANPEHAPYGVAARELLTNLGIWSVIKDRLVFGENVSQAAQFATTGSVDAAILSLSAAASAALARRGNFVVVESDLYRPIRHRMVLLKGAGPTARAFYDYLQATDARAILANYGFARPQAGP